MRHFYAAIALFFLGIASAFAASVGVVVTVNSPPSTSVTCTPVASFTTTAPAGAAVCPIAVLPSGWAGSYTLSGADAASFGIVAGSPTNLVVGAVALAPRVYNVTITAAP